MSIIPSILSWWAILFLIGLTALPAATKIFGRFADLGYIFAKILGLAVISYLVWLLGSLHLLPLSVFSIWLVILLLVLLNLFLATKSRNELLQKIKEKWKIIIFEEALFSAAFLFWTYIRAHEPSIHGLEKFMDFGFINSILRTEFFPPKDLWFTPETINYYYFGHLVTAVLTKLSGISPEITFNLMMATIFGLTLAGTFSIGMNLFARQNRPRIAVTCGLLSAFLVTLGGNLHTIYAFTRGFDKYWYPDATRFIPYTIHEFPSYSWVVSDLHGHVLDIPFVLLTIALLLSLLTSSLKKKPIPYVLYPIPFVLAIMYMTNAWDGIIYFGLTTLALLYLNLRPAPIAAEPKSFQFSIFSFQFNFSVLNFLFSIFIVGLFFFLFSLPFSLQFKPFASGVFPVRDHSLLYMLAALWGFFYFFAANFLIFLWKTMKQRTNITISDVFVILLILLSTLLLLFPEIAYVKDIYPLHYRANTMFKLGYQAFIMLSISSAYIFTRIISSKKNLFVLLFFCFSSLLFIPIAIYPYFAIKSYYNGLKVYQGLNGMDWFKNQYLTDYEAIMWLRNNVKSQPVILEAVGESYTDYARVSSFTGLPTVLGWPVHEWLWRGTYDEAGRRDAEVKQAYETPSLTLTKGFLEKYKVEYVFVGILERQKYPTADFTKWEKLGKNIYRSGQTLIYRVSL